MNNLSKIISFAVLAICGALMSAPLTNATSIYDNSYKTTDKVISRVTNSYNINCEAEDLSLNWSENITDVSKWSSGALNGVDHNQVKTSFQNALDSGSWTVSVITSYEGGGSFTQIKVAWTETTGYLEWNENGVIARSTSPMYEVVFMPEAMALGGSNCRAVTFQYGQYQSYISTSANDDVNNTRNFLASNWTMNIPEGYEGQDIVQSHETEVVPDYESILSYNFQVDNKAVDYWNTTEWGDVDKSKIVCRWSMGGENSGTVLDSLSGCDGDVRRIVVEEYDNYILRLDVLYGTNKDGFFNPEDDEEIVGSVERLLKVDGQTYGGGVGSGWTEDNRFEANNCFQEFFPFINLVECGQVIAGALSILSFNTVTLGNNYNTGNQCTALVTLGAWMQTPNITVCPQISSEIRNIITPFVTLALALGMIGFITRQKQENIG